MANNKCKITNNKTADEFKTSRKAIEYYYKFSYGRNDKKISKKVNRKMHDKYGTGNWNDLSKLQKEELIFIELKDYLLAQIKDENKRKKVESENNGYNQKVLIELTKFIRKNEENIDLVWKKFENLYGKDEKTKNESYKDYINTLKEYNPDIVPIEKEEWIKLNSNEDGFQFRIYDQIMSETLEIQQETLDAENYSNDNENNKLSYYDIAIQTIVKVLKQNNIADIDLESIRETINILNNCSSTEDDFVFTNRAKYSDLSEEEQKNYEEYSAKYTFYKSKLDNLDFIKYK